MGFFSDDKGNKSMTRLLSFIVVIGVTPMLYLHPEQAPSISLLLGGVVGAKAVQKRFEQ